jgi:hypothetical protein
MIDKSDMHDLTTHLSTALRIAGDDVAAVVKGECCSVTLYKYREICVKKRTQVQHEMASPGVALRT